MRKINFFVILMTLLLLVSCETKKDKIAGKWDYAQYMHGEDPFLGAGFATNPQSKCNAKKDCFLFESDGSFQKKIYSSTCADSLFEAGKWSIKNNKLEIIMDYDDHLFQAKILKLTNDRLVLQTDVGSIYVSMLWVFSKDVFY